MKSRLKYNILNHDQEQMSIELIGRIDETFNSELFNLKLPPKLIINLDRVHAVNSVGIQEWILWVSSMSDRTVFLSHCQKAVVDQINTVEGFRPNHVKVSSFYIPYFNVDLNIEKNVLIKPEQLDFNKPFENQVQKVIVDDQGHSLEIDVIVSKYFRFLAKGLSNL